MAHKAETVGLASWVMLNQLLVELDGLHPGLHARVLDRVDGVLAENNGPNVQALKAVFAEVRAGGPLS